jgi:hypothetical protein
VYVGFYASATDATKKIFESANEKTNWSNVLDLSYPVHGTEEDIIRAKLGELFARYEGQLLSASSEAEFDKFFDEMMEEADKIGLAKLNTYLANAYKENCEKFGTK